MTLSLCFVSLGLSFNKDSMASAINPDQRASLKQTTRQAEQKVRDGKILDAIRIYESSLSELKSTGKVHLRLGQLYQKRINPKMSNNFNAEMKAYAGYHFLKCLDGQDVSKLVRKQVCERELTPLLAPLKFRGVSGTTVEVLNPRPFQGFIKSGAFLPKGPVTLSVYNTSQRSPQQINVTLPHSKPLDFSPARFIPARPKLEQSSTAEGIQLSLGDAPASSQDKTKTSLPSSDREQLPKDSQSPQLSFNNTHSGDVNTQSISRVPGYVLTALGVSLISAGVAFHFIRADDPAGFDKDNPADLPMYLWAPGLVLTGAGAGWLIWTW